MTHGVVFATVSKPPGLRKIKGFSTDSVHTYIGTDNMYADGRVLWDEVPIPACTAAQRLHYIGTDNMYCMRKNTRANTPGLRRIGPWMKGPLTPMLWMTIRPSSSIPELTGTLCQFKTSADFSRSRNPAGVEIGSVAKTPPRGSAAGRWRCGVPERWRCRPQGGGSMRGRKTGRLGRRDDSVISVSVAARALDFVLGPVERLLGVTVETDARVARGER